MALSHDEIDKYLCDIFLGSVIAYIKDTFVKFIYPNNDIKQKAKLLYDKSYDNAKREGLLPLEELKVIIEQRDIITEEERFHLKSLESKLEAQKILLAKTTRVKANKDRIKGVIEQLTNEINSIYAKTSSKYFMSAETKAEEDKTLFICGQCTYRENGDRFWNTYEDILKETDILFKDSVLVSFVRFYGGISTPVIREIARSNLWRIRYVNSIKTSDPLFGVPASDYTTDQLSLVYWSNYYQNIYEMMPEDRPSDATIEDDDELDAYMLAFYEDRHREEVSRRSKTKRSGKLQAFDAEEVIVTSSHELYEDIDYDKPREAQKIKDRVDLKKRTKRG
jgi:SepF-like predicted cell division protein (DUF552 family)